MKPVVVLVGCPNVGKSTLFNRLTRSRAALVADEPGLTRDRQYGDGRIGDRPYLVVDTGGIVEVSPKGRETRGLSEFVARQTLQAVTEADAVILIVDGRAGLQAADRELAEGLRRLGRPVWLAVNKAEGLEPDIVTAEFHALGLGRPYPISAARGDGVGEMMNDVLAPLPLAPPEQPVPDAPSVAVVGRPNVGKSTLVNALLGEERVLVSGEPGTTRDSIRVPLERAGRHYTLIDTAGVRRRARIRDVHEKYSVIQSLQAIDEAHVVILLVDGHGGVTEQDAALAGYALEHGRSLVVAVNKWDAVDEAARVWTRREVQRRLSFLGFARFHYISALRGKGVGELFTSVDEAFRAANRTLSTPKINRVLRAAVLATPPPIARGRRIRLKYAHQGGKNPPRIVVHGSQAAVLPESYRRYLANAFRRAFQLEGTPVRIECRQGERKELRPAARRGRKTGGPGKKRRRT